MTIRTLIVENDDAASFILEAHLDQYDFIEIIESVPTIKEALDLTITHKPDLVFLDIELNDGKAFDYLKELPNYQISPDIIFMTAWSDYAAEAYRFLPFAFLEKPFNKPLLHKAIEKYRNSVKENPNQNIGAIREWLSQNEKKESEHKLRCPTKDGFTFIDMDEILYFEAERRYTIIYFSPERTMTLSTNLGKVEELLPESRFLRINRSIIINLKYILSLNRKKYECVLLKNGETITINVPKERINELAKSLENI